MRPFREDILKMPGGENGKAYQCLNEMSTLISQQQHVIRQTHQHIQKPQPQENLQEQDRKKLSEAEADLGDSAQHLYAKMAAEMENKPIGEALDNLAKAEKSLDRASKLLDDNVMNEAQNRERSALAELVAARKMFQKAVSDNPKAFEEPKDEEPTPIADSAKKLSEMAEFRNEAKAAQEFVQKSLEQQRSLEHQTAPMRSDYVQARGAGTAVGAVARGVRAATPAGFQGDARRVKAGAASDDQGGGEPAEAERRRARRHAAGHPAVGEAQ